MKVIAILFLFLTLSYLGFSQENSKGDLYICYSIGPNFANFTNSEAPNKINIQGSDERPVIFYTADLEKSIYYTDYQTTIIGDILIGLSTGIYLEYFILNNLSAKLGLNIEMKGINLKYSNKFVDGFSTREANFHDRYGEVNETLNKKINNNYFVVPLSLRKYFTKKKNLFIESGIYSGYLISSKIDMFGEKIVDVDYSETDIKYRWSSDNITEKDIEKEYTSKFDFGFLVGAGYSRKFSEKLIFQTNLLLNIGMIKVDSKYNNEFSAVSVASGTNFSNVAVRSTNYYGLNSNSKNINLMLTFSIGYQIGKKGL